MPTSLISVVTCCTSCTYISVTAATVFSTSSRHLFIEVKMSRNCRSKEPDADFKKLTAPIICQPFPTLPNQMPKKGRKRKEKKNTCGNIPRPSLSQYRAALRQKSM